MLRHNVPSGCAKYNEIPGALQQYLDLAVQDDESDADAHADVNHGYQTVHRLWSSR